MPDVLAVIVLVVLLSAPLIIGLVLIIIVEDLLDRMEVILA
jgi:hypothetical protein